MLKKILIIEDNKDLQEIYSTAFKKANYNVEVSDNGLTGIMKAVEFDPVVILLDIMMPDMNGMDFLIALNKNTSKRYPVYIFTNVADSEVAKKCIELGAKKVYLKSDYTPAGIVEEIEEECKLLF